ncbi:MAG: type II toxin-antitoxin system RelE/ParE family toxin [Nitrospiraceae bacterium]|nr:type II toxin-antitoxin system RelE/ParE family toxin [Nitrospiraceae bacterium]
MPPSLTAPRTRLACRLSGFVTNPREECGLDGAEALLDLRIPPGNRLEKLSGSRHGQMSIRINNQRRICFIWKDGNAHGVEIVDYH